MVLAPPFLADRFAGRGTCRTRMRPGGFCSCPTGAAWAKVPAPREDAGKAGERM